MKKTGNEIFRLNNIINGDRLSDKDEFNKLLSKDITKLLYEYFEFNGYPIISLEKKGNSYNVKIEVLASAIKNFSFLPNG